MDSLTEDGTFLDINFSMCDTEHTWIWSLRAGANHKLKELARLNVASLGVIT
jgi:hypothetical protein